MTPRGHEDFARFLEITLLKSGYVLEMVEVYLDESGTHKGAPILCVGGYLFERDRAKEFDAAWRIMLQELEVPFFHMSACEADESPFDKTPSEIRQAMVNRAIGIIQNYMTYGIVVAAVEEKFDSIVPVHPLVGNAYSVLANQVLSAVKVWADRNQYDGPISYFFESGHAHQEEANRIMNLSALNEQLQKESRYTGHAFRKKQESPALQAADLLVWHYCNDWTRQSKGDYSRDRYARLIDSNYWHFRWKDDDLNDFAATIKKAIETYPDAGKPLDSQSDA